MSHKNKKIIAGKGEVVATNMSPAKGTPKRNVFSFELDHLGVVGDAHAGIGHRQVSLLDKESIDAFVARTGKSIEHGDFGENITYRGIDVHDVALLDKLYIGETELEITQIGKECHGDVCAIYRAVGQCIMPRAGLFARVLCGGRVAVNDIVCHVKRTLKVLVITLSDRAYAGIYADKAGPAAQEMLEQFFANKYWRWQMENILLSDDERQLRSTLQRALRDKVDIVFTLGGTGVGARDIAPDVAAPLCEKTLPGVMEHIRLRYGAVKPAALLSRGIAGVAGKTQIYTLPGGVQAVKDYLGEIFLLLEHVVFMLHGIDKH